MRIRGFSKTSLDFVGLQIELLGDDGSPRAMPRCPFCSEP